MILRRAPRLTRRAMLLLHIMIDLILQLQSIKTLLLMSHGIDARGGSLLANRRDRRRGSESLGVSATGPRGVGGAHAAGSPLCLLRDDVPFVLARELTRFGAGLRLVVVVGAVVEELGVDLHEEFHCVVDHAVDGARNPREVTVSGMRTDRARRERHVPIPVAFGVLVQRCEHDWQDGLDVLADEIAEVLVIPEIERSFRYLKIHDERLVRGRALERMQA